MVERLNSDASCAGCLDMEKRQQNCITSGGLVANGTSCLSSRYALNIIEVTRAYMGLEPKVLKNDMV